MARQTDQQATDYRRSGCRSESDSARGGIEVSLWVSQVLWLIEIATLASGQGFRALGITFYGSGLYMRLIKQAIVVVYMSGACIGASSHHSVDL